MNEIHPTITEPTASEVLDSLLARFPPDQCGFLIAAEHEHLVGAESMTDTDWLDEQLRLRARRWSTDDSRVLATLWWYSASAWVISPTLASLALGNQVLSCGVDDLALHWLPDSRITGATSSRVLPPEDPITAAATSLSGLYKRVIPAVADRAGISHRPLWAIASDALATRLLVIGRAIGDVERVTSLLAPLFDAMGPLLPRTTYTGGRNEITPKRISCCLLYLAPGQSMCNSCPRLTRRR